MSTTREDAEKTLLNLLTRAKARGQESYDMDDLVFNAKRYDHTTNTILFALWSLVDQGKVIIQDDFCIRLAGSEKS